jgi:GABA(A) receptor-associated protein
MAPTRVAIIIREVPGHVEPLKALVDRNKTVAELMAWVRIHVKMDSKKAMFMFVNGTLPANSSTVGAVWDEHKSHEDGRLYVTLKLENTFG